MAGMYGCFKGRNSDSAAMASGPPDVMVSQEPVEVQEECSGKKKSKFQTFKKFFARKKKKEAAGSDAGLKASQSTDDVSKTSENNTLTRSDKDKGSGSKISLGSKALSHDSVFVSDSSEANEAVGASQDSIHGKVKSLQLQLKQAIRLGSPPSLMCVKKTEDTGTMSEDDGLPCSPPEYTALHPKQTQRTSSISLEGIDSDDEQLSCAASSRALSPLVVPGDFSQPASPFACLDNSAAKHKLGLRHKACNKRKPATRQELKTEGGSVVDEHLDTSISEALEEQEQHRREVVSLDELKPKVGSDEDEEEKQEEEEEEEETERSQHSRQSLLRYEEEEKAAGEDESDAEQDVSHSLDTSCPAQPSLWDEDAPDGQPSSTASSPLDTPRATPEPPAGPREYLLDPPGVAYGAVENRAESELDGEEDGAEIDAVKEDMEEESSLLQEVLSSLKTPLVACSLSGDTDLDMERETEEMDEDVTETEDGKEDEEEEAEADEPVGYQAAASPPREVSDLSCQEEVVHITEEEEEEAEEETEEEVAVEHFGYHKKEEAAKREEVEEVRPEEESERVVRKPDIQTQEERQQEERRQEERRQEESETEEEVMELEKEPKLDEEEWGNRGVVYNDGDDKEDEEEEDVEEEDVCATAEADEAFEEEREDGEEMMETMETVPDAPDEEDGIGLSLQEEDEGVDAVVEDDAAMTSDDEIPTEAGDQALASVQEERGQSEMAEEGVEIECAEPDHDEDEEPDQPDVTETVRKESCSDLEPEEEDTEQTVVSAKPPSLSLLETHQEAPSLETGPVSPSRTTTIHINLVSPSSEQTPAFFQQPPPAAAADPQEESPCLAAADTEQQRAASAEEDQADDVGEAEEDIVSGPAPLEEAADLPSTASDQGKVRFTIATAWQRSRSLTPPSSPPACASPPSPAVTGTEEEEAEAREDPAVPASSPQVEVVLSPGRARNAGGTAVRPLSCVTPPPPCTKPQSSAATSAEESAAAAEGSPDSPFGVRLRKTSALHLFSSEEENKESPIEAPMQPISCKAEPPQPSTAKPSVIQPISNKPALPKKPDVHGDSGVKTKRISDPAAARSVSAGSDSPSWISVAKQKQKIYKENPLDAISVKKEEPVNISAHREPGNKAPECTTKVSPAEVNKPSASAERESRRSLSPPTPVPPQPFKTHSLPTPLPPKPQVLPATAKPAPQAHPDQRPLPAPAPAPVPLKPPAASLPSSKTPQTTTVPPTTYSVRTAPEASGLRAAGLPGQTPSSQRGLPPPVLAQDEPPWMALAKKKAKAWSEMPQIVQ